MNKTTGYLRMNPNNTPCEVPDGIFIYIYKKDCHHDKRIGEYVIPCTITYTLPKTAKKGSK